ncbi:MAG: MFS transporter, partial [Stellaceae bacterium]
MAVVSDAPLVAGAARRRWILAATVVMIFMTGVEGTVIATAVPTIVSHLGGFADFTWVFSAYYLAQGATIPIYGRLADLFGRKRVLFFGLTLFIVGTTLCGFAPSMGMLVAFRFLQGLGAGAVQPIN